MNTNYDMTTKLIPKDFLVTVMLEDSFTNTLIFWYLTTVEAWPGSGEILSEMHKEGGNILHEGRVHWAVNYLKPKSF